MASDPATSPRVLSELAEGDRWRSELLDLVVSHPRIPKGVLEEMALADRAVPQFKDDAETACRGHARLFG